MNITLHAYKLSSILLIILSENFSDLDTIYKWLLDSLVFD